MSNLNQFGKALESYCGDKNGYFPCYPGWGTDPSNPGNNTVTYETYVGMTRTPYQCAMTGTGLNAALVLPGAVVSDEPLALPQYGATLGTTAVGSAFPGPNFFRTIFFGQWQPNNGATGLAGTTCFCGPVGLGHLMTGGYIKDSKVYICPSASGMPWDAGAKFSGQTRGDIATLLGQTGLDDATALCGGNYPSMALAYSGNVATAGWQGLAANATNTGGNGNAVYGFQSSYNYRGVPISTAGATVGVPYTPGSGGVPAATGIGTDASGSAYADFYDTTTPGLLGYAGCPQFKTQKLLVNRAIVCDTFSKWSESNKNTATLPTADIQGYGQYAHRDTYNVLYGDWHAKIVGDSNKRILNWSQASSGNPGALLGYAEVSASIATIAYPTSMSSPRSGYTVMPTSTLDGAVAASQATASDGFLIWHYLDQQEGIDVK
jgi:hypothetical protein